METWETIRLRCRRDGEPIKSVARDLGLAPNTVRKYLRQDGPPTRTEKPRKKLLDRYASHIDELIRGTPKITAVRVGSYLQQNVDADLRVDQRTLREYVAARRRALVPREAFIRASYAPGDQSQFDFSPMSVRLGGVLTVIQLFVVRLSYSGCFVARASIRCDQPSLFAGLLWAFTRFGGLTRTAVFDNASTAVRRVLRGRSREENDAFAAFRGGLALNVEFAAPAKGNEKGGVEGVHGYIEDNFFRPLPSFTDLDSLNAALSAFCDESLSREHSTHHDGIVEVYEDRIRIIVGDAVIAEHPRGFGVGERFLDPRHYIELLAHKHRAAASAMVLADGRIPAVLRELFERYCHADSASASKRWTQVLALLADVAVEELAQVVTRALACGTDDPAAIALMLAQNRAPMPTALLRSGELPAGARCEVAPPDLAGYATMQLAECAA